MAREDSILPILFFKIILQTNLQRIQLPNKFTRKHGVGLSNPVLIKLPDGTGWKVYWKKINGEMWFEKGWKTFTENYSLEHGCLVMFEYKGTSKFDVVILGQNAVEIDYDSSSDTNDENDNVDHSDDDESVEILDEWLNRKKARQRSPFISTRPHKKVRGDHEKTTKRTSSINWPKNARAQEVAQNFISCNPFFTVLINPNDLEANQLSVPDLKGVIENKDTNVMLLIGKRSWNVKLLRCYEGKYNRRLSAGWHLFLTESGLKSGDVCVFELINKKDLVFKVHVY
ncbi:B3 domain-containing transcription factor VRN1 [Medicago truncatula]|uniref:Plant-specific B3-DNA-binding domain protein n=1 Tax=Medicago truncatula TaxID=3880 RepID=G8A2Z4_MEDTR|nr:B3 domain-containing transcription factor VRN1 [Medicago truncatula]AES70704.1 plant-specific B3-DNA-binding domain protein [Medicago truncatula]